MIVQNQFDGFFHNYNDNGQVFVTEDFSDTDLSDEDIALMKAAQDDSDNADEDFKKR